MSRVGLPGTGGGGIDRVAQLPANPQPGTVVYVTADYAPGGAYRASDFDIAVTVRRFSDRRAGFLRGTGEGSISPDIAGIEQIAITQAGTIEVRLSDELDSYFGDAMAIRVGSALVALAQHPGTGAWQSAAGNAQWPLNAVTTVRLVTTDETSGITPEGIRTVGALGNPRNPLPTVEEDYYHVDPDTDDWVRGLGRGSAGGAPAALLPQTGLSDADMRDHKWKGVLVGLSREDAGSDWRLLTAAGSALGVSINVSAKTITLTHRAADTVAEIAAFLDENDVDEDTTLYSIMVGDTNGSATIQTAPLDRPFVQVFSEGSLPHPTRDQLNALVQRIQSLTFADIGGEIGDAQVPGSFTRDSELTKAFLLSVIGLTSSELDDLVVGARVTGSGSSRAIVVEQKDGSTINLPVPDTTGVTADDHVTAVAFVNNGASIRFTFSEGPTLTVNVPAELRVGVNTVLPQIKAGAERDDQPQRGGGDHDLRFRGGSGPGAAHPGGLVYGHDDP